MNEMPPQMNDRIIIVGASGFGRECLDVAKAMQQHGSTLQIIGVVDDNPSKENLRRLKELDVPYLGTIGQVWLRGDRGARFVLGIGNPKVRKRIAENLEAAGHQSFSLVHPKAILGSRLSLGQGSVICAGAIISTNVTLGKYVHVNPNSTIGHDVNLKDFVSVNPAATISGEVTVNEKTLIGAGATVLQQLSVGDEVMVGAAALVTKNVPNGVVVTGVPGRWRK